MEHVDMYVRDRQYAAAAQSMLQHGITIADVWNGAMDDTHKGLFLQWMKPSLFLREIGHTAGDRRVSCVNPFLITDATVNQTAKTCSNPRVLLEVEWARAMQARIVVDRPEQYTDVVCRDQELRAAAVVHDFEQSGYNVPGARLVLLDGVGYMTACIIDELYRKGICTRVVVVDKDVRAHRYHQMMFPVECVYGDVFEYLEGLPVGDHDFAYVYYNFCGIGNSVCDLARWMKGRGSFSTMISYGTRNAEHVAPTLGLVEHAVAGRRGWMSEHVSDRIGFVTYRCWRNV